MKILITLSAFLLIGLTSVSQTISSVTPNIGSRGTASLPITISGSGTNFYNGSFTNASNIRFRQGSEMLRVITVSPVSKVLLNVTVEIKNTNSLGSYHVDVLDSVLNNFVTLTNGFTVIRNSSNVPEISTTKLSIYPNPSFGVFSIVVPDFINEYSIKIYDPVGNLILNQKNQSSGIFKTDLSEFSSGVYFVVLQSEETVFKSKLIRQ